MNINWEEASEFGRRETLLRALRRLEALRPGAVCVVETGTLRNDTPAGRDGDGWSTVAWGWYCVQVGGRVYTVDINEGNLEVCRRVTAPYAAAIEYVQSDSVEFLRQWTEERRGEIHLLYMDSLDYLDTVSSESHHRAEAEAALPSLARRCLVLMDDSSAGEPGESGVPSFRGKGALAGPFLVEHGFAIEWSEGGQVLLSRDAQTPPSHREPRRGGSA